MGSQALVGGRETGARGSALLTLLRDAARLDRTQSDPVVAARNAIGVAAPLAIGIAVGGAAVGLPSSIGALQTAFADRPGPYRLRMLRMLGTAAVAATTGGLAVALSQSTIASAALLTVLAFVAGLLVSAGPSAIQVGTAATAAALVLGHQAERPGIAIHVALLVLAGGAAQTVLAVAAWPLRRHGPERRALAGLYRSLAGLARDPVSASAGPPLGDVLQSVRATLYGLGHDHGPSVEAYRVLLDEAERIRREVVVLGGFVDRLARAGAHRSSDAVRGLLATAAQVLDALATSLDQATPIDTAALDSAQRRVEECLSAMQGDGDPAEVVRRAAAVRVRGLAGQLRAAVATSRAGASEGSTLADTGPGLIARLREPFDTLRANVSANSAVLRHAVRLGVLVGGSDLVLRAAGVDRGYWVPLTVLVVLRPDFATTFQRASMRVAGTIVGLVLATALVHWVPGGEWYAVALIGLFFFGMRLAGPGNLALGAVCLAALVVLLLSLAGVPAHTTVVRRGLDTAIGGALALGAILLRPAWERDAVPHRLVVLLQAYRDYTAAVADLAPDPARLNHARAAARRARTDAQLSVDRARSEPVPAQGQVELGQSVLANTHRFVNAVLTIDTLRPALRKGGGLPEFQALMGVAQEVLAACADAVDRGVPPASRELRPEQEALAAALAGDPSPAGGAEAAAALTEAADRLADSLDTLVTELCRQLGDVDDGAANAVDGGSVGTVADEAAD